MGLIPLRSSDGSGGELGNVDVLEETGVSTGTKSLTLDETVYDVAGTYTYTCPENTFRLVIIAVGGGSGGQPGCSGGDGGPAELGTSGGGGGGGLGGTPGHNGLISSTVYYPDEVVDFSVTVGAGGQGATYPRGVVESENAGSSSMVSVDDDNTLCLAQGGEKVFDNALYGGATLGNGGNGASFDGVALDEGTGGLAGGPTSVQIVRGNRSIYPWYGEDILATAGQDTQSNGSTAGSGGSGGVGSKPNRVDSLKYGLGGDGGNGGDGGDGGQNGGSSAGLGVSGSPAGNGMDGIVIFRAYVID